MTPARDQGEVCGSWWEVDGCGSVVGLSCVGVGVLLSSGGVVGSVVGSVLGGGDDAGGVVGVLVSQEPGESVDPLADGVVRTVT